MGKEKGTKCKDSCGLKSREKPNVEVSVQPPLQSKTSSNEVKALSLTASKDKERICHKKIPKDDADSRAVGPKTPISLSDRDTIPPTPDSDAIPPTPDSNQKPPSKRLSLNSKSIIRNDSVQADSTQRPHKKFSLKSKHPVQIDSEQEDRNAKKNTFAVSFNKNLKKKVQSYSKGSEIEEKPSVDIDPGIIKRDHESCITVPSSDFLSPLTSNAIKTTKKLSLSRSSVKRTCKFRDEKQEKKMKLLPTSDSEEKVGAICLWISF